MLDAILAGVELQDADAAAPRSSTSRLPGVAGRPHRLAGRWASQSYPTWPGITVETIHSAFKVGRDRDAAIPPGRLRHYDLIIFDEVSQIDAAVWQRLQVALGELTP